MAKDYSNYMAIETGLTDNISLNVLLSTLGQLSDGMWENSRVASHYWPFAEAEMINDKVCLMISKDMFTSGYNRPNENYFRTRLHLDPAAIKKYFANKVKLLFVKTQKIILKQALGVMQSATQNWIT